MWSVSCACDLLDGGVHALAGCALHFVSGMTIDVEREGGGGVAEVFLNSLHVVAVLQ